MSSRILRSYERMAQQEHYCKKCQTPIISGELYRGTVAVNKGEYDGKKRSWVTVDKAHSNPEDCHDWELDLEFHSDMNRTEETERAEQAKQSLTLLTILAQARTRRL